MTFWRSCDCCTGENQQSPELKQSCRVCHFGLFIVCIPLVPADKAWMVIQHNNTELTKLKTSSGINQHLAHFNYSADAEQIQAIITQAEYCEQELSYHCKKSRLLNTPGKPFLLGISIAPSIWKVRLIKTSLHLQTFAWRLSKRHKLIVILS